MFINILLKLHCCKVRPFAVAGTWRLASRQAMTELSTAALSRNQARAVVLLVTHSASIMNDINEKPRFV